MLSRTASVHDIREARIRARARQLREFEDLRSELEKLLMASNPKLGRLLDPPQATPRARVLEEDRK